MKDTNSNLYIVALVEMNKKLALVLNRPLNMLYKDDAKHLLGSDEQFKSSLYYSKSKFDKAFAGREIFLNMQDGTTKVVKDDWWSGLTDKHVHVSVSSIEELSKCYVFFGADIIQADLDSLIHEYKGKTYGYWEYGKFLKESNNEQK